MEQRKFLVRLVRPVFEVAVVECGCAGSDQGNLLKGLIF